MVALRVLCYILALVGVSYGWGRPALAWSGLFGADRVLAAAGAVGLGLGLVGLAAIGAGCLGLLGLPFALFVVIGGAALAWPHRFEAARAVEQVVASLDRWAIATALLFLLPALLVTCPPIYGDEVTYHTFFPEQFARTGWIPLGGPSRFVSYPLLTEALAVPGLLCGVPEAARANQLVFALLTALTLSAWGAQKGVRPWVAPFLFFASPLVMLSSGIGYVSATKAYMQLVVMLGFLEVARAHRLRDAVVVGLYLGLYLWAKQTALACCLFLGVCWLAGLFAPRRLTFAVLAVAVLVHAPHWITNLVQTGDPLFPYGGGLFHGRGWNAFLRLNYMSLDGRLTTVLWSEKLGFLARLFAGSDATNLEGQPLLPHVGWLLPLAFVAAVRRGRESRFVLAFAATYVILWIAGVGPLATRALMPVLPLTCLLEAEGLEVLAPGPGSRLHAGVAVVVGVLLAFQPPAMPFELAWRHATGNESADAYFARAWGDVYRVQREMDAKLPAGTPVLAVYVGSRSLTHCRLVMSHDVDGAFIMASAATRAAIEKHATRVPSLLAPTVEQLPVVTTRAAVRAELDARGLEYLLVNAGLGLPMELTLVPLIEPDLDVVARAGRVTLYRLRRSR